MALRLKVLFNKTAKFIARQRNFSCRMSNIRDCYKNAVVRHPYLNEGIQTALLLGSGDLFAQIVIEKKMVRFVDWIQAGKVAGVGFFLGPVMLFWYEKLDRLVKSPNKILQTVQKVAYDQVLFAPPFIAFLVCLFAFLQVPKLEYVMKKLQDEYLFVMSANYVIWPWVQFINFGLVPLRYQVLLTQFVTVAWNIFITSRAKNFEAIEVTTPAKG